jgi:hypothetical protein
VVSLPSAFCKRSFHLGCMEGRMTAPIGDDKWFCDDCVVGQHLCFICNERGVDFEVQWDTYTVLCLLDVT